MKLALVLGCGTGLFYLAVLPPAIGSIDGTSMFAVAVSLVTKHNFTVPPSLGILGADGLYYSGWYPLLSVLSIPFVALGLALGSILNLPGHGVAAVCALVLPVVLTAMTTSLVALLSLGLSATARGASLVALAYAFGTIVLVYTRTFFAEPLAAFLTAAGLYFAFCKIKRKAAVLGILSALAVLAKPTGVILGIVLSGYLLVKTRKIGKSLAPLIGMATGLLIFCFYNQMRFAHPLSFGQPWALFSFSYVPVDLFWLLFSPGAGLIWYCPPVILFFLGFHKSFYSNYSKYLEAFTILIIFLSYLFLHSFWWSWGGNEWGPRYLIPALPGLFAWIGVFEKKWRRWLIILTAIGFFVNAPTLISFFQRFYHEANEQGITKEVLLWSPRHAPAVQGVGLAWRTVHDALRMDVHELVEEAGSLEERFTGRLGHKMVRIIALWWWMLPVLGVSRWVGALVFLFLSGIGTGMIAKAVKDS